MSLFRRVSTLRNAVIISLFTIAGALLWLKLHHGHWFSFQSQDHHPRVVWFIPDGLRAEPEVFKMFEWAKSGKLPNIRYLMENGAYGYSIPVFPGHTPANFATLFTGKLPKEHGISDGPIRLFGHPLQVIPLSGFSSTAKLTNPIWYTLEKQGFVSTLLTVPGSTPPEISSGQVVRGRWGNWGFDFPSVVIHSARDQGLIKRMGRSTRTFYVGKQLTLFRPAQLAKWEAPGLPRTFAPNMEVSLENWGEKIFALLLDTVDDGIVKYDSVAVSHDRTKIDFILKEGEWSQWFDGQVTYQIQHSVASADSTKSEKDQGQFDVRQKTTMRLLPIQIGSADNFRFRIVYDPINPSVTMPANLSEEIHQKIGPGVDYPDDFPPQLVHFDGDRKAFLDEAQMSFAWHKKILERFLTNTNSDIVIHNIYTPNQMLTSRWWMGEVDPKSTRPKNFIKYSEAQDWNEILELYKNIDDLIGTCLKSLGPKSYLVFSSDHGIAPLNQEVRLNNEFKKRGWLKWKMGAAGPEVDWTNSKVVFLQSNHVYIHSKNLAGDYQPDHSEQYSRLRDSVRQLLKNLSDKDGHPVYAQVLNRHESETILGLPQDRVGDLVLSHNLGFSSVEDMTTDGVLFNVPLRSGYKQGLEPSQNRELWTPFMVIGPGVPKGQQLREPISHLDQYPFIMKLMGAKSDVELKNNELKSLIK